MDRYLRDRIETITEADFWAALRARGGAAAAVAAGRAGQKARAYRLLTAHYGRALAGEARAFENTTALAAGDAPARRRLRRRADAVLRHEIEGWHGQTIRFGRRIDFDADFGQSGQYGFHYLGWLRPLLEQYVLTGAERDRAGLLEILWQYYAQRTRLHWRIPRLHPVYYELGAYTKTMLLLPALAVLARRRALSAAQAEMLLKLLLGFARSLYRLQRQYRRGNWQLVGAKTLYWLGCALPEFRAAARWRRRGLDRLRDHARRGFLADGGHEERCWSYGWMSLSGLLDAYRVGLRTGYLRRADKGALTRTLRRAFRWFAASVSPTQHMLPYGDGSLAPAEPVFAAARQTFPDLDRRGGLLGVDRGRSCILRPSGYAFLRCGAAPDAPQMSVNFGPWGGGHTHADLLDFDLWCFGEPLLTEVGRFGSYDHPLNPLFRSPEAHNQVVLEHLPMDRAAHAGREVLWQSTERADFFSAWHEAYQAGGGRVRIRRSIVFVKPAGGRPAYWLVQDVVTAREYIFQASSYLHAPRPLRRIGPGTARIRGAKSCLVAFAEPDDLRRFQTGADYTAAETAGRDAEKYPLADERHRLTATKWRDVGDRRPIVFTMLLLPFRGRTAPRARVRSVAAEVTQERTWSLVEVDVAGRRDLVCFNPGRAAVRHGRATVRSVMAARLGRRWVACP